MLFNKISIFDGGMGSMIEALGLDVTNVEDLKYIEAKHVIAKNEEPEEPAEEEAEEAEAEE